MYGGVSVRLKVPSFKVLLDTHAPTRVLRQVRTHMLTLNDGGAANRLHNCSLCQRLDKDKKGCESDERNRPDQAARLLCPYRLGEQLDGNRHADSLTNGDQQVGKVEHRSSIGEFVQCRTSSFAHKGLFKLVSELAQKSDRRTSFVRA